MRYTGIGRETGHHLPLPLATHLRKVSSAKAASCGASFLNAPTTSYIIPQILVTTWDVRIVSCERQHGEQTGGIIIGQSGHPSLVSSPVVSPGSRLFHRAGRESWYQRQSEGRRSCGMIVPLHSNKTRLFGTLKTTQAVTLLKSNILT